MFYFLGIMFRKRFGLPANWIIECSSQENDWSFKSFLGSGDEQSPSPESPSTPTNDQIECATKLI